MKDNNINNTENIGKIKGLKTAGMKKVSGGTESIYPPAPSPAWTERI